MEFQCCCFRLRSSKCFRHFQIFFTCLQKVPTAQMDSFMNNPGMKMSEFDHPPFDDDPRNYRTHQYYIQALLRNCPDDVNKLVTCPDGEDLNGWIYSCYKQFLVELNYFAYHHRDVCDGQKVPTMSFTVNGVAVECKSAAKVPPATVPAIDYFTETIDQATSNLLDDKKFPSGVVSEEGLLEIKTSMRRLYRIFSYSYACHRELFDALEKKNHLCQRFTKFAQIYRLMDPRDIHIPDSYYTD